METLMNNLRQLIQGKKIMILGFGREGRSSLRRVCEAGGAAEIAIADRNEVADAEEVRRQAAEWQSARQQSAGQQSAAVGQATRQQAAWQQAVGEIAADIPLVFFTGEDYQKKIGGYDVILKSPGIVLEPEQEKYLSRITSEAELFLKAYRDQVVGITGTKGKSTTTTLLYHVLSESGKDTVLMGNIGIPAFDKLEEITPDSTVVFEFSCHQLEYNSCSPHRAIYLNLYEEHLDHYGTFEKYKAAKENIYRHQTAGDVLYCGNQVRPEENGIVQKPAISGTEAMPELSDRRIVTAYPYGEAPWADAVVQDTIWLSGDTIHYGEEEFSVPVSEIRLLGHHNLFDIAVVYAAARDLGVTAQQFEQALRTYRPLPHRLEYIGTYGGVRYYDDSISTICETTIQALNTLPDTGTVLIGGMDRGIDYADLIAYLAEHPVPNILLMADTGRRIAEEMERSAPKLLTDGYVKLTETLEEAVELAVKLTPAGMSCVLSPAAASYGIFKNFEERGRKFCELVLQLAR